MQLGAFSVSLAVKDIAASKLFCEVPEFRVFMGVQSQNCLNMKNGDAGVAMLSNSENSPTIG